MQNQQRAPLQSLLCCRFVSTAHVVQERLSAWCSTWVHVCAPPTPAACHRRVTVLHRAQQPPPPRVTESAMVSNSNVPGSREDSVWWTDTFYTQLGNAPHTLSPDTFLLSVNLADRKHFGGPSSAFQWPHKLCSFASSLSRVLLFRLLSQGLTVSTPPHEANFIRSSHRNIQLKCLRFERESSCLHNLEAQTSTSS